MMDIQVIHKDIQSYPKIYPNIFKKLSTYIQLLIQLLIQHVYDNTDRYGNMDDLGIVLGPNSLMQQVRGGCSRSD